MKEERNHLAKVAYPQLQDYCQALGFDFQVVDMRWGVTNDATNEHITTKLCLQEISNCQRVSVGPSFVVSSDREFIVLMTVIPNMAHASLGT